MPHRDHCLVSEMSPALYLEVKMNEGLAKFANPSFDLVGRTRFELVTNGLKVIGLIVFCSFVLSLCFCNLLIIINFKFNIVSY